MSKLIRILTGYIAIKNVLYHQWKFSPLQKVQKSTENTEKIQNKKVISKLNFTSCKYLHISISIHFFPGH